MSLEFLRERNEIKKRFIDTSLRALKWFIYYYVTFMILMIFMTLLKNLVGGLRPIFLQMCQPDMAANCSMGQYINSDYKCTNPAATEFLLFEIRRSFPSGHATASVYITFFFMRYLEAKFSKFRVTLSAAHLCCSVWAVVCCVSRITEHFHHVGDVIAGIILAIPFLFYSVSEQKEAVFEDRKLNELNFRVRYYAKVSRLHCGKGMHIRTYKWQFHMYSQYKRHE